jgi:hypothetical protein
MLVSTCDRNSPHRNLSMCVIAYFDKRVTRIDATIKSLLLAGHPVVFYRQRPYVPQPVPIICRSYADEISQTPYLLQTGPKLAVMRPKAASRALPSLSRESSSSCLLQSLHFSGFTHGYHQLLSTATPFARALVQGYILPMSIPLFSVWSFKMSSSSILAL